MNHDHLILPPVVSREERPTVQPIRRRNHPGISRILRRGDRIFHDRYTPEEPAGHP